MCQWQILKMWCNVLKGTFTIHVALYFNYLILLTIRGTSNIFLDIIQTELASHLIVFCRLFLFPSQLSVKRTYNLVLLFHLNICIIVTTALTAYETGICTFPPNSRILIIVKHTQHINCLLTFAKQRSYSSLEELSTVQSDAVSVDRSSYDGNMSITWEQNGSLLYLSWKKGRFWS